MTKMASRFAVTSALVIAGAVGLLASCATMSPMMGGQKITLDGASEVPAVATPPPAPRPSTSSLIVR